jgi:hypothetical protein
MKKILIASISALFLFMACKKDENTTTGSLDLTLANIAGKYRTTGSYITLKSSGIGADIYDTAFNSVCKKFSYHTFSTSNVYSFYDSCANTTTNSTYSVTPPNILTYNNKQYLVQSLTTTKLVIAFDSTLPIFGDANFKLTLTKQ